FQFDKAIFCDLVNFTQCSFEQGSFTLAYFLGFTNFRYALFVNGDKVRLDIKDMSNISFRNTDITNVRFGENVKWGSDNRYKIFDESILEKGENVTLDSIITTYRNLQKNYDNYFRYEESDKFYLREMELRRNYEEFHKNDVLT